MGFGPCGAGRVAVYGGLIAATLLASCAPLRPARAPVSLVPQASVGAPRASVAPVAPAAPAAPAASADSAAPLVTRARVVAEVTEVFGDTPPTPTATDAAAAGPVWDIDVRSYETRDRVEYFVGIFSGRAKGEFARSLQRQSRYGDLIRTKLREGGLPEDMTYLALIESWYDPHAYSRAAAVGMWQFMAGTARGVGMRVDWWIDERRDPVRATQGAVRYLKGLKAQFGSLYLAAAAYNGGDGRVSRGLARYADNLDGVEGDDRFFTLADTKYLRPETRDYVPKLIAAALVGKEPARYGVTIDSLPPFVYDSVMHRPLTSLAAVANASGASVAEIKELNPHILRGTTPPLVPVWVRIPLRSGEGYGERFDLLDGALRLAVLRVESKKGQSMTSIARKHGITAKQLGWFNPRVAKLKSGNLRAGQIILVPTRATLSAAFDVPDPSIERYPKRSKVTGKRPAPKGSTTKAPTSKSASSKALSSKASAARKPNAKRSSAAAPAKNKATLKKPAAKVPASTAPVVKQRPR